MKTPHGAEEMAVLGEDSPVSLRVGDHKSDTSFSPSADECESLKDERLVH